MKQREYSELQKHIMRVIGSLMPYLFNNRNGLKEIEKIKKEYDIKEPYSTLRQYINQHCFGAYHTFHFTIKDKNVSIDTIEDMLTDELCSLYPLTNQFYVVKDTQKSIGNNCENSHTDHYLKLEPKED